MNLTILSFVHSQFICNSPAFVNNHLSIIHSHINQFTGTLFYNQQSLFINSVKFSNGLGSIIFNEYNSEEHQEIRDQIYDENNLLTLNKDPKRSITILNCQFLRITSANTIIVDTEQISLYLTNSIFISCQSQGSANILLQRARCLTMTHVCSSECGSNTDSGFLNYDCRDIDFSYCLYNTFVDSKTENSPNSFIIFIRSGSQFYRCNNMTKTTSGGFHFSSPECFSFAMTTVMNCGGGCFQISGYSADSKPRDKLIEMVNFFSTHEYLIMLSGECKFRLTFENSVLLNKAENPQFILKGNSYNIIVDVRNCIILNDYNNEEGAITFSDCTRVDYDILYLTLYPHFTYDTICAGPIDAKVLPAQACNGGNCVDEQCDQTIGFPDDVIPYTTIELADLRTPTFTPSSKFSQSSKFSESLKFTESHSFSASSGNIIGNLGGSSKGSNKAMIGGVVGAVAAVAIIAVIIAVIFIRRHKNLNFSSNAEMMETNNSEITTQNELNKVMKDDDPFADEFNDDDAANASVVI